MNTLLDKYAFLLPCQIKNILSFCQDFLDELNYFCDTWVTLTESMWTGLCQWNWRVVNSLKKHCEIGALGSAMVMAALPVQVGDDCTKATEWGYSSAGQSLGRDFGAKISQQFFRSCSSGWPTKASRSAELQAFLFLGWAVDQSDGKIQALYDFKYRFIGNEVPSTSMELWFC